MLRASKADPAYRLHGYWAKKSPGAIAELVEAGRSWARHGDREPFEAYLDRYVRGPETHVDYLETVGLRRLLSLHEY